MSEPVQTELLPREPEEQGSIVEIALPLPVAHGWSYRVPEALREAVVPGARVAVPFRGRPMAGIVIGAGAAPEGVKLRSVLGVLDELPLFDPPLLAFLRQAADYYLHPIGEVLRGAAPPLPSDALTRLKRGGLLGERGIQGAKAKTRRARFVQRTSEATEETLAARRLGPHQRTLMTALMRAEGGELPIESLPPEQRNALKSKTLADLVHLIEREVSLDRYFSGPVERDAERVPTDEQKIAIDAIIQPLTARERASFLLFGVTGSGKTEVYLQAIAAALALGRGALVLVPEIALTPQLVGRFRARFGDTIAVLHSGLSEPERAAFWRALRRGTVKIAIGARSAVFAPVQDLGLIVVDEEHDGSYKQEEGFRYHARDLALLRAHRANAVVVLGSATPSLESFDHAQKGTHTLLTMNKRPLERPMPSIELVDLGCIGAGPSGERLLSVTLHRAIEQTLEQGGQAILFLNRRGFAPSMRCAACGEVEGCPSCSVTLVAHLRARVLRCHSCDYAAQLSEACSKCGEPKLEAIGAGTERLEGTLEAAFPSARIARLDRDVAQGGKLVEILDRVRSGEVDILIGTQMVTKGHDLPGVTLVGVLLADQSLFFPDFRAAERTYQLLSQVAGRAGRGDKPGRVLIQTFQPKHFAVLAARDHDYLRFVEMERAAREELGYPPSGRLIAVRVDAEDRVVAERTCAMLAELAQQHPDVLRGAVEVKGPAPAPIERIRNRYRQRLFLRAAARKPLRAVAIALLERIEQGIGEARASVDVDPVSML